MRWNDVTQHAREAQRMDRNLPITPGREAFKDNQPAPLPCVVGSPACGKVSHYMVPEVGKGRAGKLQGYCPDHKDAAWAAMAEVNRIATVRRDNNTRWVREQAWNEAEFGGRGPSRARAKQVRRGNTF